MSALGGEKSSRAPTIKCALSASSALVASSSNSNGEFVDELMCIALFSDMNNILE